jgi:uncharacterized membrane protein YjjB (DUF3815 family)
MEVVITTRGRSGVAREAYVIIIVIMIIPVEDTMSLITSNAITMIYIGMISITIDKINMKSADLIILVPGVLIIVPGAMSIKEEPIMIRVVQITPVSIIVIRKRN